MRESYISRPDARAKYRARAHHGLGPLLYVIPFFFIVANPQDNSSRLAQLYFGSDPCRAHSGCWSRATGRPFAGRNARVV